MAREHLAAGKQFATKIVPYLTRTRALFFALYVDNKSYNSAKHNHELDQIRISNHWHQPLSIKSGG